MMKRWGVLELVWDKLDARAELLPQTQKLRTDSALPPTDNVTLHVCTLAFLRNSVLDAAKESNTRGSAGLSSAVLSRNAVNIESMPDSSFCTFDPNIASTKLFAFTI